MVPIMVDMGIPVDMVMEVNLPILKMNLPGVK